MEYLGPTESELRMISDKLRDTNKLLARIANALEYKVEENINSEALRLIEGEEHANHN